MGGGGGGGGNYPTVPKLQGRFGKEWYTWLLIHALI